jgi:hypothetical protein
MDNSKLFFSTMSVKSCTLPALGEEIFYKIWVADLGAIFDANGVRYESVCFYLCLTWALQMCNERGLLDDRADLKQYAEQNAIVVLKKMSETMKRRDTMEDEDLSYNARCTDEEEIVHIASTLNISITIFKEKMTIVYTPQSIAPTINIRLMLHGGHYTYPLFQTGGIDWAYGRAMSTVRKPAINCYMLPTLKYHFDQRDEELLAQLCSTMTEEERVQNGLSKNQ